MENPEGNGMYSQIIDTIDQMYAQTDELSADRMEMLEQSLQTLANGVNENNQVVQSVLGAVKQLADSIHGQGQLLSKLHYRQEETSKEFGAMASKFKALETYIVSQTKLIMQQQLRAAAEAVTSSRPQTPAPNTAGNAAASSPASTASAQIADRQASATPVANILNFSAAGGSLQVPGSMVLQNHTHPSTAMSYGAFAPSTATSLPMISPPASTAAAANQQSFLLAQQMSIQRNQEIAQVYSDNQYLQNLSPTEQSKLVLFILKQKQQQQQQQFQFQQQQQSIQQHRQQPIPFQPPGASAMQAQQSLLVMQQQLQQRERQREQQRQLHLQEQQRRQKVADELEQKRQQLLEQKRQQLLEQQRSIKQKKQELDIQAAQTVPAALIRVKTESTPSPFPIPAPATAPVTAPIRVNIEPAPVPTPVTALLLSPLQGKKPVEKKPEVQSTTVSKPTPPPMSNMMPVSLIKQTVVAAPPQAQVPILLTCPSAKSQSPLPTLAPKMFTLNTSSSSLNAQIPQVVSAPKTQIPQVVSSYKAPVKAPATTSATAPAKTKANRPPAVPPMPPIGAMASKAKVASASVSSARSTVSSESGGISIKSGIPSPVASSKSTASTTESSLIADKPLEPAHASSSKVKATCSRVDSRSRSRSKYSSSRLNLSRCSAHSRHHDHSPSYSRSHSRSRSYSRSQAQRCNRSRSRSMSRLRSTSRRCDVDNRLGQLEVTIKGATKHAREDDSSSGRNTKRQHRSPRISGVAFFGNSNSASDDDDDDELIKRYSDPDDVEFGIVGASGLSRRGSPSGSSATNITSRLGHTAAEDNTSNMYGRVSWKNGSSSNSSSSNNGRFAGSGSGYNGGHAWNTQEDVIGKLEDADGNIITSERVSQMMGPFYYLAMPAIPPVYQMFFGCMPMRPEVSQKVINNAITKLVGFKYFRAALAPAAKYSGFVPSYVVRCDSDSNKKVRRMKERVFGGNIVIGPLLFYSLVMMSCGQMQNNMASSMNTLLRNMTGLEFDQLRIVTKDGISQHSTYTVWSMTIDWVKDLCKYLVEDRRAQDSITAASKCHSEYMRQCRNSSHDNSGGLDRDGNMAFRMLSTNAENSRLFLGVRPSDLRELYKYLVYIVGKLSTPHTIKYLKQVSESFIQNEE
ncbi:hypothetical protein BX661DRAFT_35865 [Kickxella alabastrina]|uniref:uncharacterized protein n=1 Tax=Kickxella alabastrina TaxID=61397 RepID=UPI00221EEB8B|nr:uncharacterized protein BX661DRAFT_35865 [Kickxella alabastrina]KAI7825864.1 hypothetical protein BX661DRAFT_35865 [Kickxella alabastrina]